MFMFILLAFGRSNGYALTLGMIASASVERNLRLKGPREDADRYRREPLPYRWAGRW